MTRAHPGVLVSREPRVSQDREVMMVRPVQPVSRAPGGHLVLRVVLVPLDSLELLELPGRPVLLD